MMKAKLILMLIFSAQVCFSQNIKETVTISGTVTDFDGKPIDSCVVQVMHPDFSTAYKALTDKKGKYAIQNIEKGKYMAVCAIRPKEYPRENAVPDKDKRLEFWAWNVIANEDLTINPRYDRLELYGLNIFQVEGGYPGLMIYVRPMSLGKLLTYSKEIVLNKSKTEKEADLSIKPEYFKVNVFIDDQPVNVNSIQPTNEFVGKSNAPMRSYLIHVDLPKNKPTKPYRIIRIDATNTEYGEKGENLYFYEIKNYK